MGVDFRSNQSVQSKQCYTLLSHLDLEGCSSAKDWIEIGVPDPGPACQAKFLSISQCKLGILHEHEEQDEVQKRNQAPVQSDGPTLETPPPKGLKM